MIQDPNFNLRVHLGDLFHRAIVAIAPEVDVAPTLERPKSAQHGDFACNVALQLSKALKRNPREIAQLIRAALPVSDWVDRTEIAGAGFINVFLKPAAKQSVICEVLQKAEKYGCLNLGANRKILVEFVSANPTGPLHVGHGRGAAYGASLANILEAAGWQVAREYYVNDAGRQMDILALSVWLRYLELAGVRLAFPTNGYQGEYVREMAQAVRANHAARFAPDNVEIMLNTAAVEQDAEAHLDDLIANAKRLLGADYVILQQFALNEQLRDCRQDLDEFGVKFEQWFSEQSLYDSGRVAQAVARLQDAGHLYQREGALWFRSTDYGDEKDRVVRRENGQYTYFASDIAYHLYKFERGYDEVVDVWGADHHGYIPRVSGALTALGVDASRFVVALVQFAVLYRHSEKVSMSTRAGEFVTLRELRREVGNDAARFFYVLRKSDQHLDFDLDLAKSRSNDNPVYYIQYAHARVCSVLREWNGDPAALAHAELAGLNEAAELELMQKIADYPDTIEHAAGDRAPHLLAFYLRELAAVFHGYYNDTRILVDDERIKLARLALAQATRQVLVNGLHLLGVSAPERM